VLTLSLYDRLLETAYYSIQNQASPALFILGFGWRVFCGLPLVGVGVVRAMLWSSRMATASAMGLLLSMRRRLRISARAMGVGSLARRRAMRVAVSWAGVVNRKMDAHESMEVWTMATAAAVVSE